MNTNDEACQTKLSQFYFICKKKQHKVEEWLLHDLSIINSQVSIDSPTFAGYTALHFAVICKNLRAVKVLLEHEADFTVKNVEGQTALHLAMKIILLDKAPSSENNLIPIIDEILVAHKQNYANVLDNMGLSHFHIACFRDNCQIVSGFLENNVDFNNCISHSSLYWSGYTPLHIASRYSMLSTAELLIKFGADVNRKNKAGFTPLQLAIKKCDELLVKLLFSALCQNSVNPIDNDGISLLHVYCTGNYRPHSLDELLQQVVETNITVNLDSSLWPGYTPLLVAVHFKYIYPIMLLLQRGANVNAKDADDVTLFQLAIRKKSIIKRFIHYIRENIKDILETDAYNSKLFDFFCVCMDSNLHCIEDSLQTGLSINTAMSSIYGINLSGYTALHFAVERGNIEMMNFLLTKGADLSAQDDNGLTPLHLAVYKKDYSIVNQMFSYYIEHNEVTRNPIDNRGLSFLHIACLDNRIALVQNILGLGVNVDMVTSTGETPLHFAAKFNRPEIIRVLLDENADFTLQDTSGSTPLHIAISKQFEDITKMILLLHHRRITNPVDNFGLSHFHILCMTNEAVLIEQFILKKVASDHSVRLDCPKYAGFTALHFAVKNGCAQTAKILLSHGFCIASKDALNKVALQYVGKLRASEREQILEAFWPVIENEDWSVAQTSGLNALHIASMRDEPLVVENLLRRGYDVNARSSEDCATYPGYSPLHVAVRHSSIQMIQLLISKGAHVNIQDKYALTPLHLACSTGKLQIIHMLLANKADPSAKSQAGLTPLRLAIRSKSPQSAQILQAILSHEDSKRTNPMDNTGLTYFHIACLRGMTQTVRDYIQSEVNIDEAVHPFARKYASCTPLHIAVQRKNLQLIDLILGQKPKINARNREGCTALHLSCTAGASQAELVRKLLLCGAEPQATNHLGLNVVELAIGLGRQDILRILLNNRPDLQFASPQRPGTLIHQTIQLLQAKEHYDYARIFIELMEHGYEVDATDGSGQTALHQAYWSVNVGAFAALLACGANVDVEDRSARTVLSYSLQVSSSMALRLQLHDILFEHASLRKLTGFTMSRTNELLYARLLEERGLSDEALASACQKEFELMSSTRFAYASLYEMLRNGRKMARCLAANAQLVQLIKSNRLAKLFPKCGCLLMMQYTKALTRSRDLLQPALQALDTLIRKGLQQTNWNEQCSDILIDYLGNDDLRTLAAAVRTQ